ncbi:MAG: hypothetical protein N2327_03540 [Caldimicrobium sp.]|nr:hypothetical protein [Caldimicrobium sp.]MDW8093816.1 hypothetical protein [Caldimicrobium sp.]
MLKTVANEVIESIRSYRREHPCPQGKKLKPLVDRSCRKRRLKHWCPHLRLEEL